MDLPSRIALVRLLARTRSDAEEDRHAASRPWYIVRSDDKRAARLNTIAHLLSLIPHKKLPNEKVKLPKRSSKGAYDDDASIARRRFVSDRFGT